MHTSGSYFPRRRGEQAYNKGPLTRAAAQQANPESRVVAPSATIEIISILRTVRQLEVEIIIKSDAAYKQLVDTHTALMKKAELRLWVYCLRCFYRVQGAETLNWVQCRERAQWQVNKVFEKFAESWRLRYPLVPYNDETLSQGQDQTNVDRQLALLAATLSFYDELLINGGGSSSSRSRTSAAEPILTESAKALRRRRRWVAAMLRQRQIVAHWACEIKAKAGEHTGVRYRREGDEVLDLWEGTSETTSEFDARMNKLKAEWENRSKKMKKGPTMVDSGSGSGSGPP
jgi:hypothetical protein